MLTGELRWQQWVEQGSGVGAVGMKKKKEKLHSVVLSSYSRKRRWMMAAVGKHRCSDSGADRRAPCVRIIFQIFQNEFKFVTLK
jgi:hypothetical protein